MSCDNEEAITKIISDYERKISEMEKLHLNKNENLLKVIEILQGRTLSSKLDKQLEAVQDVVSGEEMSREW